MVNDHIGTQKLLHGSCAVGCKFGVDRREVYIVAYSDCLELCKWTVDEVSHGCVWGKGDLVASFNCDSPTGAHVYAFPWSHRSDFECAKASNLDSFIFISSI